MKEENQITAYNILINFTDKIVEQVTTHVNKMCNCDEYSINQPIKCIFGKYRFCRDGKNSFIWIQTNV